MLVMCAILDQFHIFSAWPKQFGRCHWINCARPFSACFKGKIFALFSYTISCIGRVISPSLPLPLSHNIPNLSHFLDLTSTNRQLPYNEIGDDALAKWHLQTHTLHMYIISISCNLIHRSLFVSTAPSPFLHLYVAWVQRTVGSLL